MSPTRPKASSRALIGAGAVALLLALALSLTTGSPSGASTGGSATATAVDLTVGPLTVLAVPVLGTTHSTVVQAATPPSDSTGNGQDSSQLLSLDLASALTSGVVTSETHRTPAGLRADSTIANADVSLLGVSDLVSATTITSSSLCPVAGAGATSTSAMVAGLKIGGVAATVGSLDVPVGVSLGIPGVTAAQLLVSVTQEQSTTANSAAATALRVRASLHVDLLVGTLADAQVLDLSLARTTCDRPTAMTPVGLQLTPPSGPIGTEITITGAGFVPGFTSITFGGLTVPAAAVSVVPDGTVLTFLVPVGSPDGPTPVVVNTPGGSSAPLSFTVTSAPPPSTTTTPSSTTPASTTPASTTPASTTPASTTPASTTPASTMPPASTSSIPSATTDPGGPTTSTPATTDPTSPTTDPSTTPTTAPTTEPTADCPNAGALSPSAGPRGTAVMVSGCDFVPGATEVIFADIVIEAGDVMVNPDGHSLAFVVPQAADLGRTEVAATTPAGRAAPLDFTVTGQAGGEAVSGSSLAPTALPRTGMAGFSLAVLGLSLIGLGTLLRFRAARRLAPARPTPVRT